MASINPFLPQEAEMAIQGWVRQTIEAINLAESLAEFGEATLTEANRTNGTLIQGYDAQGIGVPWTAEQLAAAQAMFVNARAFANWARTATGNPARSPLQRLQAMQRTIVR